MLQILAVGFIVMEQTGILDMPFDLQRIAQKFGCQLAVLCTLIKPLQNNLPDQRISNRKHRHTDNQTDDAE